MDLVAALPALEHDPDRVRETARELLSRPPFRDEPEGLLTQLVDRVGDRLGEVVGALLDVFSGQGGVLAWAVVVAATALLAAAVWRWSRGALDGRLRTRVPSTTPRRGAAELAEEAARHEASGRWREAVRGRYAQLVAALHEAGIVDELPGRTVRELDREVAAVAPELAAPVRAAGERFEAVWYGHAAAGPGDVEVVSAAAHVQRRVTAVAP